MKYDFASQELPKKRTGWHVHWLARTPAWRIAIFSFLVYAATVLVFSGLESVFHCHGVPLVVDSQRKPVGFSNLFYFNFVMILTIGYRDLSPVGWGRFFSIVEAIIGVAFFSLVVAVITSKMISPPQDTIVFSKYAYYCTDNEDTAYLREHHEYAVHQYRDVLLLQNWRRLASSLAYTLSVPDQVGADLFYGSCSARYLGSIPDAGGCFQVWHLGATW